MRNKLKKYTMLLIGLTLCYSVFHTIQSKNIYADSTEWAPLDHSDYQELDYIVTLLKQKEKEGYSVEQLNTLGTLLLNLTNRSGTYSLNNMVYSRLNKKEKALFDTNVLSGMQCLLAAQTAVDWTNSFYSSGFHNGNADAFRHAFWHNRMVYLVGSDFARKFGQAHEDGDLSSPFIEVSIDKFNNNLGLIIRPASNAWAVRNAIRSGRGKILVNGILVSSGRQGEK